MNPPLENTWEAYRQMVQNRSPIRKFGRVHQLIGLVVEGIGPRAAIGETCEIESRGKKERLDCEVVGFRDRKVLLMPLGDSRGIQPGDAIFPKGIPARA